jgi:hypothetical protein
MKARDLAALAALGIAGKYAYDKFGGKGEAKEDNYDREGGNRYSSPVVENDSAEVEVPRYVRDRVDRTADIEAEARMGKRSRQENDVPEKVVSRQERDVPDRIMGRDAAGSRFTDKAAAEAPAAKPVAKAAVTRSLAPVADAIADDYVMPRTAPKPVMPDASRVTQYNSDIMYAPTVKSDPNVEHDDEMNRLARTRATRQGAVVAQTPNAQAQARILRQGPTPAQSATNAQAQARLLRQGAPATAAAAPAAAPQQSRYTKDQYGNIIDNTTGKVSRTIFSAGQQGNAARNGMKRGGVVKMASGGMTSSKMSKPSGASRGDGIAQRGRTRGTLR